jgi:hypothetical protein
VSEGSDAEVAESIFCGACGADIDASARFCRSCGADQLQFSEPEPEPRAGNDLEASPAVELVAETRSESSPAGLAGLRDALIERHGFAPNQPSPGDGTFNPGEDGVIGVLGGLPLRVEEGSRPDDGAALIRVRFGLASGDPEAVERAFSEVSTARLAASRVGVEVLAAATHAGNNMEAAIAYVEDLARRAAAAMKPEGSIPPSDSARALTVCGYPQWVDTADIGDVEGIELRHFELREGQAEWAELAVRLAPSADGAMVAIGTWDEEAPFISLLGRVVLMRKGEDGRETPVMFGSGICTLTNRRLLAVVYARPDDDVLQGLGQNMRDSGITFQDASGRNVNPFNVMPEEEKALQFIDEAGAVDEEGGGVVLALSAFPQAFARVDLEGGFLQRGLGIPGMQVSGGPLTFNIVPFRVLDEDSHTVKPRRGQIKDAVNAWWAMTAQASQEGG